MPSGSTTPRRVVNGRVIIFDDPAQTSHHDSKVTLSHLTNKIHLKITGQYVSTEKIACLLTRHLSRDSSSSIHYVQARRVLAIFNGENPWKDDFEMATERARSTDAESLFGCGSKRKRTWSR